MKTLHQVNVNADRSYVRMDFNDNQAFFAKLKVRLAIMLVMYVNRAMLISFFSCRIMMTIIII